MESVNVPLSLSDEEFESMTREFNSAGDWMLEQLALKRSAPGPAVANEISQGLVPTEEGGGTRHT